jgi:hypothetical protein
MKMALVGFFFNRPSRPDLKSNPIVSNGKPYLYREKKHEGDVSFNFSRIAKQKKWNRS